MMNNRFLVFIVLCYYHAQYKVAEAAQSLGNDNEENTEAHRIAAGQKYFSSLESDSKEKWVDPYKMFDYDEQPVNEVEIYDSSASTGNPDDGLSEVEKSAGETTDGRLNSSAPAVIKCDCDHELRTKCSQNEYIYVTRWLKKFLKKMNYNPKMNLNEAQIVQFSVGNIELHEISKLLDSQNTINFQDVEHIFDSISSRVSIWHPESRSFADVLHILKDNYVLILTLLLCLISLWYLHLLYFSRHFVTLAVILVCLTSVIWTWIHMYQKELAKKQAKLHSGYPKECDPSSLGFFSHISYYFQKSLWLMEDNCAKYYEAYIVDPFWSISPLMVFSETVSNFILQPVESVASHCNIFIKTLFSGMPAILAIPMLCFLFFIILMVFRYRIRLPYFFATLEPADNAARVEFLPFRSANENAIAHYDAPRVAIEASARASPQQPLQELHFGESGDHVEITSHDNVPHEQSDVRPVEALDLPKVTESKGNYALDQSKRGDFGELPHASQMLTSFGKMTLTDQSCQTDQVKVE